MASQTGGLLAGTADLSVDGTTYMVTGDFKYKPGNRKRETLGGMDSIHGYKETPSAPFISFNLRDWGGLTVADINTWTDVTCAQAAAQIRSTADSSSQSASIPMYGRDCISTRLPTSIPRCRCLSPYPLSEVEISSPAISLEMERRETFFRAAT